MIEKGSMFKAWEATTEQQKPETRQHPQETDVLFGRFPKDRPEKQHRQNHNAAVEIGGQEILEQFFHHSSSG